MTLPRLYAILDLETLEAQSLKPLEVLDVWLQSGVRLIQLRAKRLTLGPTLALAEGLLERTRAAGARLILNDRIDAARLSKADGVHLGQLDLTIAQAREQLQANQIIGVSTHNADQARRALGDRPDYLAIGPIYPTASKRDPDPVVGVDGVSSVAALARGGGVPLVAIGGITLETAPRIIEAGARSIAVISDLFAGDWRTRAAAYVRALD